MMKSLIMSVPSIEDTCRKILPLPRNAILLGVSENEEPILIDVHSGQTSNLLIFDKLFGQGIQIIKTAIEFILKYKTGNRVEFVVVSNRTKEWEALTENGLGVWSENECVAVVPFWHIIADQVLCGLAEWVSKTSSRVPLILFIDGIENVDRMCPETIECVRTILDIGREKSIYVIATANSRNYDKLSGWAEKFQKEIFGVDLYNWFEIGEKYPTLFYAPRTNL